MDLAGYQEEGLLGVQLVRHQGEGLLGDLAWELVRHQEEGLLGDELVEH